MTWYTTAPLFLTREAARALAALAASEKLCGCDYDPKIGYTAERPSLTGGEMTRAALRLDGGGSIPTDARERGERARTELMLAGLAAEVGWFQWVITTEGQRLAASLCGNPYVAVA
jgi:hypothetical protein